MFDLLRAFLVKPQSARAVGHLHMDLVESTSEQLFGELLLVAPLIAIALLGVAIVRAAAKRMLEVVAEYGAMPSRCGLSGEQIVRRLLAVRKLNGVTLAATDKQDHYHPWYRQIRLNHSTFESPSLAALAVAAHEVGHAEQFADRTMLCRLRNIAWPSCYVLLAIAIVPPVLSLLTNWSLPVSDIATLVLPAALGMLLLQLPIHLPLETDATRRARRIVVETKLIGETELAGFDRILSTAWWTHFACDAQRCLVVLLAGGVTLWATHSIGLTELDFDDALALEAMDVQIAPAAPHVRPAPPHTVPLPPASQPPLIPPHPFPPLLSPAPPHVLPDSYPFPFSDAILIFDLAYLIVAVGGGIGLFWLIRKLTPAGSRKPPAPSTAMDHNNAGFDLLRTGNPEAAIQAFSETLALEPGYLPALLNRARTYTQLGRFDEALRDYDAAVLLAPDSAMPRERRADVHAAVGHFARAIDDYTAVIERDADRATAYRERGLMHFRREEYALALADCTRAIEIDARLFDRREAVVFNNRGAIYLKLGEYSQARADLDAAVHLDPSFSHAYKNLAWLEATSLAAEFRDGPSAVANATKALALSNEQVPDWFAIRAAAHAEARQFDEAIAWQTKYLAAASPQQQAEAVATLAHFKNGQPLRDTPHKYPAEEPALAT
jgi:Zn-dependent membrane protease YugP/tetratricopeptide (TPR) repeat protein